MKRVEISILAIFCGFLLLSIFALGCTTSASTMAQEGYEERQIVTREVLKSGDTTLVEQWLIKYPHSSWHTGMTQWLAGVKAEAPIYKPYAKEDTKKGYEEFIAKYPNSYFAETARARLAELEKKEAEEEEKKVVNEQMNRAMREQKVAICSAVPKGKQTATRKFFIKIKGIFGSMEDYHTRSVTTGASGILRKDIDRYTDTVAEAVGEVPDGAISFVEEYYSLLKEKFSLTISKKDISTLVAKQVLVSQLSQTSDWVSVCNK